MYVGDMSDVSVTMHNQHAEVRGQPLELALSSHCMRVWRLKLRLLGFLYSKCFYWISHLDNQSSSKFLLNVQGINILKLNHTSINSFSFNFFKLSTPCDPAPKKKKKKKKSNLFYNGQTPSGQILPHLYPHQKPSILELYSSILITNFKNSLRWFLI